MIFMSSKERGLGCTSIPIWMIPIFLGIFQTFKNDWLPASDPVFVLINAGHYLIWLPTMSRSVKIGFMDVGQELARRGHEVTVVTPFKSQTEVAGVREILVDSNFHEVTDAITEEEFVKGNTFVMPIDIQIDVSIEDNRNALRS